MRLIEGTSFEAVLNGSRKICSLGRRWGDCVSLALPLLNTLWLSRVAKAQRDLVDFEGASFSVDEGLIAETFASACLDSVAGPPAGELA